MKKILHVIHGLNLGGAENFIYNILQEINHEKYRFDFVIQEPEIKHYKFKELIEKTGGRIYIIPDFIKNPITHAIAFKKLMKSVDYDFIHIHINALINPIPLVIACNYRSKVLLHSHSIKNSKGGIVGKLVHIINCKLFVKNKVVRLACSNDAGRWMFGNKYFTVVSNAIAPTKFAYSADLRRDIREKYHLTDEFVIGQVGRLIPLKNQTFTIDLLKRLEDNVNHVKFKLMLVGDGPLRESLEEQVANLGLSDSVRFVGNVHNANEYYSAFDIMLIPSTIEGLAFVGVEAQANGLKVIASDHVPKDLNVTDSVSFLPLEKPELWVEEILLSKGTDTRSTIASCFKNCKLNMQNAIKTICEIYS